MSAILVFMAALAAVAIWWLTQQRLMAKPWLEAGTTDLHPKTEAPAIEPAKLGVGVLLAVIGAMFMLLISAYFMRMAYADWQAPPMPKVLWLNTAMLALASIALQCAVTAAHGGHRGNLRLALAGGTLASLAFLGGQLVAWRDLSAGGYLVVDNPAIAFFYMMTALHGLHLLGGLVALGRVDVRAWKPAPTPRLALSVELCAFYWHGLFVVWLILFVVLMGWAADFVDICRQLLS